MEKYVLIDGNSLLNRAYYAMSPFSTKEGQPTNGIFGFTKLLFKIIEEQGPAYLTVTFDLHAPTFRHRMYEGYKATRKPMPEDLVVQVPVLKDLLRSMHIHMCELEGYEADDLIGTLSRKFQDAEILIYTGDRDAYQLVNEHVNVCFTKRGVTEIDLLTAQNFYEKVGLTPAQIVEEKALMGDSSDNIPGIKGIGPKTAVELLNRYGTAENVFAHLDELTPSLQKRFAGQREMCHLSKTLATIDTDVPLSVEREDCRLSIPFPSAAREAIAKLEFRSLLGHPFLETTVQAPSVEAVYPAEVAPVLEEAKACKEFSACFEKDEFHLFFGNTEYIFPLKRILLDNGFYPEALKPLWSLLFSKDRRAVVLDVKSLAHRLDEYGVRIDCPVDDVSLLRYLCDSNQRISTAKDYAQDRSLPETHCAYAVRLAYDEAAEKLTGSREEKIYREIELPLAFVLLDMEREGVRVDESRFSEFSEKYGRELETLSGKIYALAGMDYFNLNSPFQLSEVLFEKLKFDPKGAKRNQRGGYSTSADVLERLAEEHEIVRLILRYRELQKLRSTYIDGIRPLVSNGIVHTTYNQTATATGRLSSSDPNLQNIPVRKEGKELRQLFVAREGHMLIDADYSQIELRLLAHCSGCKPMQEAYRMGMDFHAATAARVFGVPVEEVSPILRRRAKAVNFGIIYGMSAFGLAKDVGCSTQEAQAYIDRYFATYPEVKEYIDGNVRFAREHGYVETILGRKRYIPELKSSNFNLRSFGERAAMNMPLQGSSADIIKIAMLGVARRLAAEGLKTKMLLQVHDELVLDAPLAEVERASLILKEEMERAVTLDVPLTVEVSVGANWYEAK